MTHRYATALSDDPPDDGGAYDYTPTLCAWCGHAERDAVSGPGCGWPVCACDDPEASLVAIMLDDDDGRMDALVDAVGAGVTP